MSDFPFLFYGSKPMDWFEGANMGHFYELRFREPPSSDVKAKLGRAWAERTFIGAVEPGAWVWSGAWAMVRTGERHIGHFEGFFAKMSELLRAMNDIAPVAEVVFWGARADSDEDWETWTLAKQKTPSAGPVYPGLVAPTFYQQPRDPSLAPPAADADFDRGMNAAVPPAAAAPEPEPSDVDDSTPSDLDDAVARVETFLEKYCARAEFYEDNDVRLWVQYVSKNADGDGIDLLFCCQNSTEVDELQPLCEKAIAAVEKGNPNLGFEITWDLEGE